MAGVVGQLAVAADFNLSGVSHGGEAPVASASLDFIMQLAAGNAALGLADVMYHETLTIAASGTNDLDLSGVLKDPLGNNIVNAEVMLIAIRAVNGNVNNIIVGNAAATQFLGPLGAAAHTVKVEPGNLFLATSVQGWPVVGGASDLLRLANSGAGTSVDVEVLIIGRTIVG